MSTPDATVAASATPSAPDVRITDLRAHLIRSPAITDDITRDEAVIVEIATDAEVSGWAEIDGLLPALGALVEYERPHPNDRGARHALVGQALDDIDRLIESLRFNTFRTGRTGLGRTAVAGIETALLDLFGKATDTPSWRLLPGVADEPAQPEIRPYITIYHPGPYSNLLPKSKEDIDRARDLGYRSFKLEPTGYNTSQREAAMFVEDIRDHVGDDIELFVDTCYRWHEYEPALEAARAYAAVGVKFLEDPFPADRYDLWRRLAEDSGLPLATGGGLEARGQYVACMEIGNVAIMQPGIHMAGLLGSHEVAADAAARGRRVIPFSYAATSLVAAGTLHFAAANANVEYVEWNPATLFTDALLRLEIAGPEPELDDGRFPAPSTPGMGVGCDREAIERYRVPR